MDDAAEPYPPMGPLPPEELRRERVEEQRRRDWRAVRVLWAALACIAAIGGFVIAVATDRTDSALVFVGLPAGLAFLLALLPRPETLHGTVFAATTFALLLCAALIQEGAVCLLFAAPLVYAVAHGFAELVRAIRGIRSRSHAVLVLPLIALVGIEGIVPTLRIDPVQSVTLTRHVALTPAAVTTSVTNGPKFDAARPLLLRAGYPTPDHAIGAGLGAGQYWHFGQHGGGILTQVVGNEPLDGGRQVDFRLISDTSMTNHALIWRTARLSWTSARDGGADVRLTIVFGRRLDPSWYFGPLEDAFVRAGGNYLLDSLGLEPS